MLYPSLPNVAFDEGYKLPLDLFIYGPGFKGEYNLQRKIVKGGTFKNWRLNGEFIPDPPEDQDRFNILQRDDFAVFEFSGEIQPKSARMVMISANVPEDQPI